MFGLKIPSPSPRPVSPRERDIAAGKALYEQVTALREKARFWDPQTFAAILREAIIRTNGGDDNLFPVPEIFDAFISCVRQICEQEKIERLPPLPPDQLLIGIEGARFRDSLNLYLRKYADPETTEEVIHRAFIESFLFFHSRLPAFLKCERHELENRSRGFMTTLIDVISDPGTVVQNTFAPFIIADEIDRLDLFSPLNRQLKKNLHRASGHPYPKPDVELRHLTFPHESTLPPWELVTTYLNQTPFYDLFLTPVPFAIPEQSRFEHMHIVAGSGHGKTQTLQHFLATELTREDHPSLVVIDSQGDLIEKIAHLALFEPGSGALASKLIIIDPTDVHHPPALNMFDVKQERLGRYDAAAREQILNGVIELYDFMFSSLLGAELTQKQSVIFRYLARLMLTVPGATIHDLLNLMTDAAPYEQYIEALPPGARAFFEMEFSDRSFSQTKRQIQRRLWGVLENPTFERMFTAATNRVDMFDALNSGKIVLVNTAKDFLKGERSSLLGRFFIALTLQATLERAALQEPKRRPAFLYIDEAADYFDGNIDDLLTQARKYKLGVLFAHQYLDQLAPGLRASMAANTSIKLAGGVSTADARSLAPDMRTKPEFILARQKGTRATSFACYVRNVTGEAIALAIPFGMLEQQARMGDPSFQKLLEQNRHRVSVPADSGPSRLVVKPRPPPRAPPPPPAAVEPEHEAVPLASAEPVADVPPLVAPPPPERAAAAAAPAAPQRPKMPRPEPAALGIGGRQHKYIQHLLKGAAQERGYHAVIEEPILGGAGKVDLSLTKDGYRIACEISVTTSTEWELGNIQKCLTAGYATILVVSSDQRHLKAMAKAAEAQLPPDSLKMIQFLSPEAAIAFLDQASASAATPEQTVRGYKVKVTRTAANQKDVKTKRDAIAAVLARSLKSVEKNKVAGR